jgi:hypothetical protein
MSATDISYRRAQAVQLRQQGYSQRRIGDRLGVSQNTVGLDLRHAPVEHRSQPELELAAIQADARARLIELRRAAAALWQGDHDDPLVLAELTGMMAQIRRAEAVLAGQHD